MAALATTPAIAAQQNRGSRGRVHRVLWLFGGSMMMVSMYYCLVGLFVRFLLHSLVIWSIYFMGIYGVAYSILRKRLNINHPTRLARIQKLFTIPSSPLPSPSSSNTTSTTITGGGSGGGGGMESKSKDKNPLQHQLQQEQTICWIELLDEEETNVDISTGVIIFSGADEEDLDLNKQQQKQQRDEAIFPSTTLVGGETSRENNGLSDNSSSNDDDDRDQLLIHRDNDHPLVAVAVASEREEENVYATFEVGDCLVVHLQDGDPTKPFHMSFQKQCQRKMKKWILKYLLYFVASVVALQLLFGGLPIFFASSQDLQDKMNEKNDENCFHTMLKLLVGGNNDNKQQQEECCRVPPLVAAIYDSLILLQILIMMISPLHFYNKKSTMST